jgi:hypothetical protein
MNILELLITAGLFVLIWIIQILHYPSFYFVEKNRFKDFCHFHGQRISIIVIPLMISELIISILDFRLHIFILVVMIWASTFCIQVPCHQTLGLGYDEKIIKRLVRTNWIRTILWSLKLLILLNALYSI